jgi:hypothetical protein
MKKLQVSLGLAVWFMMLVSVGADCPCGSDTKAAKDTAAARAAFERLKKLVGDWQMVDSKEKSEAKTVALTYRLTAGGSALVETVFPGGEHEMVTVYHRDGDGLFLTHYCHLGNQPRMRATIGSDKNELAFEFAGGTNIDPAKDTHMHRATIRLVDDDHFTSEWELFKDGKAAGNHGFSVVRVK